MLTAANSNCCCVYNVAAACPVAGELYVQDSSNTVLLSVSQGSIGIVQQLQFTDVHHNIVAGELTTLICIGTYPVRTVHSFLLLSDSPQDVAAAPNWHNDLSHIALIDV
jgi:hypothetical protein